jgi:hypothetical protein
VLALVPAVFTAGFFGGLYRLAVAQERDEGMTLPSTAAAQNWGRGTGARAA